MRAVSNAIVAIFVASEPAALPWPSTGSDPSAPRPVGLRRGKKRRSVFFVFGIDDQRRLGKPEDLLGAGRIERVHGGERPSDAAIAPLRIANPLAQGLGASCHVIEGLAETGPFGFDSGEDFADRPGLALQRQCQMADPDAVQETGQ